MQNEDLSALRKKISGLMSYRKEVIDKVLHTRTFIAAQVYDRQIKCGKPNCKCANGELHGPFMWIYQKKKGRKVVSTTVTEDKVTEAKELAARYELLLKQRQKVRETDQKINELLNEFESLLEKEIDDYVGKKSRT